MCISLPCAMQGLFLTSWGRGNETDRSREGRECAREPRPQMFCFFLISSCCLLSPLHHPSLALSVKLHIVIHKELQVDGP